MSDVIELTWTNQDVETYAFIESIIVSPIALLCIVFLYFIVYFNPCIRTRNPLQWLNCVILRTLLNGIDLV